MIEIILISIHFCAHIINGYLFMTSQIPPFEFMMIHLCILLTYAFLLKLFWNYLKNNSLGLFSLLISSFTSAIGAGCGFIASIFHLIKAKNTPPDLSELGILSETSEISEEIRLVSEFSEKHIKEKSNIIPFLEIFSEHSQQKKIAALVKINQYYLPEFAPALLKAKQDQANDIRVLSASTIAKIEARFSRRYKQLRENLARSPDSPLIMLNLARHTSHHADCGVLDTYRESHFRNLSIRYYMGYVKLVPKDTASQVILAKLYLKQNMIEEAITLFQDLLIRNVRLSLMDVFWYLEALFESGNMNMVRSQIKQFQKLGVIEKGQDLFIIKEIANLWGNTARITRKKSA